MKKIIKTLLLLGIVVTYFLQCLCRPSDCNKAVLDVITQMRLRLDELERAHWDTSNSHRNKPRDSTNSQTLKYNKAKKHKRKRKHGLHCGKINYDEDGKVFMASKTTSISESTTNDYTTETLEMIVSTDAENLTTELSGGFTDNPTAVSK